MHKIPFHMALLSTLLCASVTIAAFTCPVSAVTPSAKAAGHASIAAHSAMVSMDKKHFFI